MFCTFLFFLQDIQIVPQTRLLILLLLSGNHNLTPCQKLQEFR